jgi:hypothetical protein
VRASSEIVELFYERRRLRGPQINTAHEIRDAYNGLIALPLPELNRNEKAAVANLIRQGINQNAMRTASTLPSLFCPPTRPGIKRAVDEALLRRKVFAGWWEMNDFKKKQYRRCRHFIGYASTPVMIRPDFTREIPCWYPMDPLGTFPAPCADPDDMEPPDCIFSYRRSASWLRTNYDVSRLNGMKDAKPETQFDMLEYVDDEEHVLIVLGRSAEVTMTGWGNEYQGERFTELLRLPNLSGICTAVVPGRVTLDRPQGQFDGMLPLFIKRARLAALEEIAIEKGVFENEWFVEGPQGGEIVTDANGREGIVGHVKGGTLEWHSINPGYKTDAALDRMERQERVEGTIPAEFAGECVDEETEIFTSTGWRRYDAVQAGDEVLTLNHETGFSEWNTVEKMNVFPAAPRRMLEAFGPRHSSLTTLNHRWPILDWKHERTWKVSADLGGHDQIPIAAFNVDLPTDAKWSDALVELVAWFYTEGSYGPSRGQVSQSTKKPENVERIRSALTRLFGPATRDWRHLSGCGRGGVGHDEMPRWNESPPATNGVIKFNLSRHAVDLLLAHAVGKVPTVAFLRSLTAAQLELFLHVSMLADNCGTACFGQKDPERSDAFAFAAILSGRAVSYQLRRKTEARPGWRAGVYESHIVRMRERRFVKPKENAQRGASTFREVTHDGMVWCPTTANGTWLARRKGSVYFTGNSASNVRTDNRGNTILSATIDYSDRRDPRSAGRVVPQGAPPGGRASRRRRSATRRRAFYVSWKGATGSVTYVPNKLFADTDEVLVRWSMPGSDVNSLHRRRRPARRDGHALRKRGFMELDPLVEDVEEEHDRIIGESLEQAVLSSLQQQAAAGAIPPADLARIMQLVATNQRGAGRLRSLRCTRRRRPRQATTVEPPVSGAPESAAGPRPAGRRAPRPRTIAADAERAGPGGADGVAAWPRPCRPARAGRVVERRWGDGVDGAWRPPAGPYRAGVREPHRPDRCAPSAAGSRANRAAVRCGGRADGRSACVADGVGPGCVTVPPARGPRSTSRPCGWGAHRSPRLVPRPESPDGASRGAIDARRAGWCGCGPGGVGVLVRRRRWLTPLRWLRRRRDRRIWRSSPIRRVGWASDGHQRRAARRYPCSAAIGPVDGVRDRRIESDGTGAGHRDGDRRVR